MGKLADDGSDVVFAGISETLKCGKKLQHIIIIITITFFFYIYILFFA